MISLLNNGTAIGPTVPLRRTRIHLLIFIYCFKAFPGQPKALQCLENKPDDLYGYYLTHSTTTQPLLVLTHFYSMATVQPHMSLFCACIEQINFTGVFHDHHSLVLCLYTFLDNIFEAAPE